jgi:hypothetical protein
MLQVANSFSHKVRVPAGAEVMSDYEKYRLIQKSAVPSGSRADMEAYIAEETGNYVSVVGEAISEGIFWRVPVDSPDGRPVQNRPLPAPVHVDLMDLVKQ